MDRHEKVVLVLILLVAAALRIYDFWDFSLSNDELSALARLNFDSFRNLIMEGVRIDGHPPAAQVILWLMTNCFGDSVFVVRFPFVLAGILAVFFVFRTAQEWISTSAGLLTSTVFTGLAFPILYSRIARPYALGMLFVAMASFFWIRILKKKGKTSDHIGLAISFALCAYSHYFAGLVAALLAAYGLLFVRGSIFKKYFLSLAGSFLLFAPYLPVFQYQLNKGGVGEWLGPPENDWLWQHIDYAFNESVFVLILVLAAGVAGFIVTKTQKSFIQNGLPLLLFVSPFLVGFMYSKYVNPVLQNSTLLFSFPFLLVFIFSGWENSKKQIANVVSVFLLISISFSTIAEKKFYQTDQFGVFKELAQHVSDWNNEVDRKALLIGDYNAPFYFHYYLDRIDSLEMSLYRVTDEKGMVTLKSIIDTSNTKYLIYSWSTVNQAPEVEEIIKHKYPSELKRQTYFNSEAVMFTKGEQPKANAFLDFTKTETWNLNLEKVTVDSIGHKRILIDAESPFGPTFHADVDKLNSQGVTTISILLECSQLSDSTEIQLVYEQENDAGRYSWESDVFRRQFSTDGPNWGVFDYQLKLTEDTLGVLKVYPWSPKGEAFELSKMEIRFR